MSSASLLQLRNITKRYGSTAVLRDVQFNLLPGEVHVLAGENGAGKSTLIKIIGGAVTDYEGTLERKGVATRFRSSRDATRAGISLVHQELSLVPEMTLADNLTLGELPCRAGFVDSKRQRLIAANLLARVGIHDPLDTLVRDLPIATQQLVEIAKGMRSQAEVVILDEPTSALNVEEAERLFALIHEMKAQGTGIVYISHKMDEISRLADRITILRDGEWVATRPANELSTEDLIAQMVGDRPPKAMTRSASSSQGPIALELKNVTVQLGGRKVVASVNLQVRKGEVVGLAGLEGAGNSALMAAIFGAKGHRSGSIHLANHEVKITSPRDALANGIAYVGSDRKAMGLVMPLSVAANVTLSTLSKLTSLGWLSRTKERQQTELAVEAMHIKSDSIEAPVSSLSGGNQQKVVLSRSIQSEPKVLLLDEPTRGIDIGAKREIYSQIEQWKSQGMAILLITSELDELLLLSDRIVALHRGTVVREFDRQSATAHTVIQAAMNA